MSCLIHVRNHACILFSFSFIGEQGFFLLIMKNVCSNFLTNIFIVLLECRFHVARFYFSVFVEAQCINGKMILIEIYYFMNFEF